MNSRTFAPLPSLRNSQIRAHYSPVFRRASHEALTRHILASQSDRDSASVPAGDVQADAAEPATVLVDDTLNELTRSTSDRWWDPHLVDRLQSPLTRYHD